MSKKKSSTEMKQIDLSEFSKDLSKEQQDRQMKILKKRFEQHKNRHSEVEWPDVEVKLKSNPDKLRSLYGMEMTGGEPDIVSIDKTSGELIFYDCSVESPKGRRSICYDGDGQKEREDKGVFPAGNAVDLADAMGIDILTEDQYRELQEIGNFDAKTSSWILTPTEIRELGGAIFADFRYNHIFIYHNSAKSFYSARGFRGSLRV